MSSPKNSGFDPVEVAISEIAKGRMVIVTDDENRENEGDVVMAASKVTPEAINHMIAHARGLICVPLLAFADFVIFCHTSTCRETISTPDSAPQ